VDFGLLLRRALAINFTTSNVTGRHRGLKWKLRAGYRVSSLQCTSYLWVLLLCLPVLFFIVECGIAAIARFLYAVHMLCAYLTFGHHPHP